jgi:hypothetical protein
MRNTILLLIFVTLLGSSCSNDQPTEAQKQQSLSWVIPGPGSTFEYAVNNPEHMLVDTFITTVVDTGLSIYGRQHVVQCKIMDAPPYSYLSYEANGDVSFLSPVTDTVWHRFPMSGTTPAIAQVVFERSNGARFLDDTTFFDGVEERTIDGNKLSCVRTVTYWHERIFEDDTLSYHKALKYHTTWAPKLGIRVHTFEEASQAEATLLRYEMR